MPRTLIVAFISLVLALTGLRPAAAADGWSGTIEIVETISGPKPAAASDAELTTLSKQLEERLARTRDRLRDATPTVARSLREDLGHLEAEMEQVLLERGGTMQLGRTVYRLDGDRVLSDGDEARVLFDWKADSAVVLTAGKRQPVALKERPKAKAPDKAAAGKPVLGFATERVTVHAGGDEFTVLLAHDLPNVYAQTLLPQADALQTALAALPGLPMEVEGKLHEATHRYVVQSVQPGAVDLDASADGH